VKRPEGCPACGAEVAPDQEYCLRCGARIDPPRPLSSFGRAWRERFGWYPGDWLWVSFLLGLVAAGSATAGIFGARHTTARSGSRTIVALSPVVTAPPLTRPAAQPAPRPRPATARPRPAPTPSSGLVQWPPRNGYTVVLASIPARGTGLRDATARARAALARGLRDVGVLVSSRFASLHPGYYVVFAGVYDSLQDAQTAASRAASSFPNAYARAIAR
jgi:hypothetical protein